MDFTHFLPKLHSLNANSYPNLGKVEILAVFTLEKMEIFGQKVLGKWKFLMISPWKSGNFKPKKLGKVEILKEICLKKWK